MRRRIAIIGGGIMGLALAQRLSVWGQQVTVYERERQLGGLSTYQDYGAFYWDRFYHVILPSDTHLVRFLDDIGLRREVRWNPTRTGLYVDGRFYSLSNTIELLRFPLVGIVGKVRLAVTVLRCLRTRDWKELEKIPVEAWLIKMCGRATYEKFWKPLLLAKLGEHYRRISAVFIWTYITRIYSARDAAAQREHLGHVSGGYRTVLRRLEEVISTQGGTIRSGAAVQAIRPEPGGALRIDCDGRKEQYDTVICTSPVDVLRRLAGEDLLHVTGAGNAVEYLGVVCLVLITRRPITPFYVLNIADSRVPFTGVIGMSTVVSSEETKGLYLTYFPKYVLSDDPILTEREDVIRKQFLQGVSLLYPDLAVEDIVASHVNRAVKVQPLQVLDYSTLVPHVTTKHPDFYVLNTSQFVNATLNNNEVIRAVDEFLVTYGSRLQTQSGVPPLAASMA
jgi:protoporphyrinogen oxidase